jgi:hypothetical protein
MYRFFESTIRPLLDTAPRLDTMVEVGAQSGRHTSRLLPYARAHGAHLHVIDPESSFNASRYERQWAGLSTLHERPSHDALPAIEPPPDVVFLDGDHNWYTVFEELRILDRICTDWPLTFLHDLEWPYGRRDMYYAPQRVPDEYRHPYAEAGYVGIVKGQSELSPEGINQMLLNAGHEGGPRNGVRTAVEDFLDATQRDLMLFVVSGNNGLGIVFDRRQLRDRRFVTALRKARARLAPRGAAREPA